MQASLQHLSVAELIHAVSRQGARLSELEQERHRITQQLVSEKQHMGYLERQLKEKQHGST